MPGRRELVFPGLPYIVVYRVTEQAVEISRIFPRRTGLALASCHLGGVPPSLSMRRPHSREQRRLVAVAQRADGVEYRTTA
jgi:hypothetical protein